MNSEPLPKEIEDIHRNIDEIISRFDKAENQKAVETQMTREFKKVRQILTNLGQNSQVERYKRLALEKEEMSKYLLEQRKGMNRPDKRSSFIEKLKKTVKDINEKIQGLIKNAKDKEKQKKKKPNNDKTEKNIEFLRNQITRLEKLRELLEAGCIFSVESFDKLYQNYLDDIFTSIGDTIFQQQTEQLYQNMFLLASLKEPKMESSPVKSQTAVPKQQEKEDGVPRRTFNQLMQLSFEHLPKWNDYRPSNETKQRLQRKALLPDYRMVDLSVISKVNIDTLFFIFYSQKGTMEQYFAAKELKARNWRYHTRYNTWFRRYDPPTQETPEFEKGTYMYFDFEKSWQIRRKTDFTIKHHALEDAL